MLSFLLTCGLSDVACRARPASVQSEGCVAMDILPNEGGKTYVAKVFALDLANEFARDVGEATQRFDEMQSLGVRDVMLLESVLATDYIQAALANSELNAWMISQIFFNNRFYDPEIPRTDPMWAVTDSGEVAWDNGDDGWLRMACPNGGSGFDPQHASDGFRQRTIARIVHLVQTYRPYGVSLDFVRYFAFWEGVAPDAGATSLPDTCYCTRCLALFQSRANVTIPASLTSVPEIAHWIQQSHRDAWIDFKTNTITTFVAETVAAIHRVAPDTKINLHAVPWKQDEYDRAIRRIVGQDFAHLSPHLDWISPMVYAKMLGREPAWISEVVEDVARVVDPDHIDIIPAIQIEADGGEAVSTADFEAYLHASLRGSASGVAFWPWERMTIEQKAVVGATLVRDCPSRTSRRLP